VPHGYQGAHATRVRGAVARTLLPVRGVIFPPRPPARLALLLALTGLLGVTRAHGKRRRTNGLLRVVTPVDRGTVPAHPFVNVIVRFGSVGSAAADPTTFHARLDGRDVTGRFTPIVAAGATVGMRARLDRALLAPGRRANHLRLAVAARGGGKPLRDVDRVRFHVTEAPDRPPIPALVASGDVLLPGVPMTFDGSHSVDPDQDELTYTWDFGDGTTAAGPQVTHVYPAAAGAVVVRLAVSDGQRTATAEATLYATPALDPGRTPGLLRLDADQALELGAVAVGAAATRTFVVRNLDTAATSQLKVDLAASTSAFAVSPTTLDLGPGGAQTVTVAFAPAVPGHQSATLTAVASARNASVVEILAHGFGGAAPATGPTQAAGTLFYLDARGAPLGIARDGTRFAVDNTVGLCQGSGDPCIVGSDCSSGVCLPGGQTTFDPVDLCSDGQNLYLLSDDVFTDTSGASRTVGVLALALTPGGGRTGASILYRTTSCTMHLACDHAPGGSLYLAEHHDVTAPARCVRTAEESLVAVSRATGAATTLLERLDAVEGLDACSDDLDPANDLEVAATHSGPVVYADFGGGFATGGGVYRAWPSPLPLSPDVTGFFQLHTDGSVLAVTTVDGTAASLLSVYKISPEQAAAGPLALADVTPCAVVAVPNDGGRVVLDTDAGSFALAPDPATGGGTLLVSFFTAGGAQGATASGPAALAPSLGVRGTVAIDVPAGAEGCVAQGFVNLEFLDAMRF
jgi:hypothetical protein